MRFHVQSPAFLLTAFILIILMATASVFYAVLSQPTVNRPIETLANQLPRIDLGGEWQPLVGLAESDTSSPGITFEVQDFIEDPDMLPDYAALNRFLERQGTISRLLAGDDVAVVTAGATVQVVPVSEWRSVATLPVSFWIQVVSGLAVILIAAFFLALRPRNFAVSAFAFAGLGITGSAYTAAIYSSRQLGMDPGLMLTLSTLNHLFTVSFGIGIMGLFSAYPVRIVDPWRVIIPVAIVSYGSTLLYQLEALPHDIVMLQNMVALLLIGILAMIFLQYRATRGRPADRAALLWLGLSVISGSATFVLLVIIPVALEREGLVTQAFGFILLAMIYVGTAFAVARYRLFDIGRWSYRILFYAGMILLLLTIDLGLILALQMPERTSLAAASVVMVLLYFPLRDLVHEKLFRRSEQDRPDLYRQAMAAAYKFGPTAQQQAWMGVLEQAFRPGHVETSATAHEAVAIANEGIEMHVPAYPWAGPVSLGFAAQGRRLFARQDVALVEELAEITSAAYADRLSYEKGAEEERQRIARDLHDDVGATLLSGLHAQDEGRRQETLVEALSDIRRIAHDLSGRETVTERFIAQLRHDTRERLRAHAAVLDWPLGSADEDNAVLPYRFHHNAAAMVREAVSNAIKHGSAGAISVTSEIVGNRLEIGVSNPVGDKETSPGDGIGLRNIASRAAELGGAMTSRIQAGRYVVTISLPLPGAA
jgi:two-component system sensor histidine kinase DevS